MGRTFASQGDPNVPEVQGSVALFQLFALDGSEEEPKRHCCDINLNGDQYYRRKRVPVITTSSKNGLMTMVGPNLEKTDMVSRPPDSLVDPGNRKTNTRSSKRRNGSPLQRNEI